MLQIPEIPNSASVSHVASRDPVTLTGRRLNRLLKHATPADRALLAHDLAQGTVWVHPLTRGQAARLTKASSGYIGTVARLSERERVRVARGELALSHLHRNPSDKALDRFIVTVGAERVMAALDRYTEPSPFAAKIRTVGRRAQMRDAFLRRPDMTSSPSPVCIVTFVDGEVTRMTTWSANGKPDLRRGIKLAHAAYESRTKR